MLNPVNLILLLLKWRNLSACLPIPVVHFLMKQLKDNNYSWISLAEDVPVPPLEGERYFQLAVIDGATRLHTMPAVIQNYVQKELILSKIS